MNKVLEVHLASNDALDEAAVKAALSPHKITVVSVTKQALSF
mgnify:CR=1 FL=1